MSELDDDLQDIDYRVPFDQDRADVDDLLARLVRIQRAISRREKTFSAEVEAYNAAIKAAFDHLSMTCNEYRRLSDSARRICSDIGVEMRMQGEQKGEESPEWDQSEEGRRHEKWLDVWDAFGHKSMEFSFGGPERIKLPKTPLSKLIAALPHRPDDLKPSEVPKAAAERRIDPKVTASVASSWRRIDAWLAANAPMLAPKMREGATPKAISETERALGLELPDAVRASYLIHDGSGIMSLFPSGDYMTLEQMLSDHKMWREMDEEYREWMGIEGHPTGPIQKVHYHLKWVPLAANGGGDGTLIDMAPAKGGVVGQLIDFGHEEGPEGVAATGLAEYLAYLADGLEAGAATIGEDTYLVWQKGPVWKRSAYDPAMTRSAPKDAASAGEPAKRYFEFISGTSSKFWEVSSEGVEMTTRFGKIGTNGQSSTKSFDSPEKAAAETAKMIAKKVKEGYVEKAH